MSTQQQNQLRWKGPPVPRAKPVPPEKWKEHKEELIELYYRMSLDDLMVIMKARHNFAPSRRQYIFQFEKWGLKKYNTNITNAWSSTQAENHIILSHDPVCNIGKRCHDTVSTSSRTSLISSHPTERPNSIRVKPPVPAKKRQKLDTYMAARDPFADLGMAFDKSTVAEPSLQNLMHEPHTTHSSEALPTGSANVSIDMITPPLSPKSKSGSKTRTTSSVASDNSDEYMLPWQIEKETCGNFVDLEQWTPQTSLEQIPQQERQIDFSKPIDTFLPSDIDDMRRAADFLSALGCDADACALYILVLKRLKDAPGQPPWAITSAIIRCALCANGRSTWEITRHLLLQNLGEEAHSSKTTAEIFLFRMLLAETYARELDFTEAHSHMALAMSADVDEQLIITLPDEHRTLDIFTYHYLTGGHVKHLEVSKTGISDKLVQVPHYANKSKTQNLLLSRKPGPFELADGEMQNPCLRWCLRWCLDELELKPSLSSSWDITKAEDNNVHTARHYALYCCLWERSQSRQIRRGGADYSIWIDQAERLMGISAAELLSTVCVMIIRAFPPRRELVAKFIHYAYIVTEKLHKRTDRFLGKYFLDSFSSCKSLIFLSQKEHIIYEARQAYAKDFVQKKLWLRLPEIVTDTIQQVANITSPRQSLEIVAASFLPTLASSLSSADLASLRDMRDRMHANVKDAMQGVIAATVLPSKCLRTSLMSGQSNLSFPSISMSELSIAMATSLSLSSSSPKLKQSTTAVRDALVAVSNKARDKVGEMNIDW